MVVAASSILQERVLIYCLGHAGVRVNERLDNLASKSPITRKMTLDRSGILAKNKRQFDDE